MAENLGTVNDPNCVARQLSGPALPPSPTRPAFLEENSATRTSAVIGRMFKREFDTSGGLGILRAMANLRLSGNDVIDIAVDEFWWRTCS